MGQSGTFIIIALVVFAIVLVAKSIKVIRQAEVMIIERLGKYNRTLTPGINVLLPLLEQPRTVAWMMPITSSGRALNVARFTERIDLRESVMDFPEQRVITRDNVVIQINGLLFSQITDPTRAAYEVSNLPMAIEKLAQTTLRNIIGELDLDKALSSRDEINAKMRAVLDDASDKWGVKINRVELQDISPPPEIQVAMEKQMKAERDRRAVVLEAEGEKASRVLRAEGLRDAAIAEAEGERQRLILKATGEAGAIEKVSAALAATGTNPAQYLIALEYLKMMREIAASEHGQKTVFLPYESAAVLGSIGSLKELLATGPTISAGFKK
ncbi:MAG TPA: SPFH domain-containing protein [Planctomycetota bacterium]|nr:SPFH domain-containing protein [Planctomycetota bacterium]